MKTETLIGEPSSSILTSEMSNGQMGRIIIPGGPWAVLGDIVVCQFRFGSSGLYITNLSQLYTRNNRESASWQSGSPIGVTTHVKTLPPGTKFTIISE